MNGTPTAWDAIVIGSGVGGLSAAAYLAVNGKRVLVLEAQPVIGGASQMFRRNRVFEFATGAHYIGDCEMDGVIPTVLRGVGLEDEVQFVNMDADCFDHVKGPGLDLRVPRGWAQFETRLVGTFPEEAKQIKAVLKTLRHAAEAMETLGVPPVPSPWTVARHPRAVAKLLPAAMTLQMLFDRHRLSEPARAAISYICMFLLLPHGKTPAPLYAWALNHYIKSGGWYVRGGVAKIPNSLARVISCHGGEVRTRTRVDKILVENGRAHGVQLSTGEQLHSPIVISNADIKTLYSRLLDDAHTSESKRRRIKQAPLTPSLFSVYLGVDLDLRQYLPAQHLFLTDTLDLDSGLAMLNGPVEDFDPEQMPVWVTSGTLKDTPPAGTEGYSSIELTSGTPQDYAFWGLEGGALDGVDYHQNPAYLDRKSQLEEILVRKTLKELPFLNGHIVWQESSTMLSHEDWTLTRHGAWAGLDFSMQNLINRPGPRTEIKGLYLAGASSSCGGAMIGTLRGGVETASAVLGRDLWREVGRGRIYGHGLTDADFSTAATSPRGGFHRLTVREVEPNTSDSVTIELEVPDTLGETFTFQAGQHLSIRGEARGEQVRRSYSICEPAGTGRLRIAVKHLPGGLFSTHAITTLEPGDELDVAPPRGTFTLAPASENPRHLAAIAVGSGITPVLSIAATALERDADTSVTLLYGNRSTETIMFRDQIKQLQQRYPERLNVHHYLSREPDAPSGYHSGRLDRAALVAHLANGLRPDTVDQWYLCGPGSLVEQAIATLAEHGVPATSVHHELFDTTRALQPAIDAGQRSTIRIIADAVETTFTMSQAEPILDAAIRARDDLPYACLTGTCGSCRARVCEGKVEMQDELHLALDDADIDNGYILPCVAHPRSDVVVLDFDPNAREQMRSDTTQTTS